MKIAKITPWIFKYQANNTPAGARRRTMSDRNLVFVQVDTDEGLTGWGEVTTYPGRSANRAICAFIRELNDLLRGDDAARIEAAWHKVFRSHTYMGTRGATSAAVSAIDIALWDIRGKALGLPIYQLLGGAVRDRIPLYTHFPYADTPEQSARNAGRSVQQGAKALKTDPFHEARAGQTAYMRGEISREGEQKGVDIVAAVREAIGPSIELLIDAHGLYNVPTAIRLANRLAPYDITWFEEPVPPESYRALQQVRAEVQTRICVGERLHTRFEFVEVLEGRLADYIMPDVTWTGGISELKKISTMAETYYVPVSPHDASGPINVLAGAHVMATVPNFYRLETIRADMSDYNSFIDHPLDVRDGDLFLSNRPGLGIEIDAAYVRANALPGFGS
jgi:galactonate dehydratase